MPIKTIFLDRDGVINKDKNNLLYTGWKILYLLKECLRHVKHFSKLGYKIIISYKPIRNCKRLLYKENDYQEPLYDWMIETIQQKRSIEILRYFLIVLTGPEDRVVMCRKAKAWECFSRLKINMTINMTNSWLIGDKEDDIICGQLAQEY